MSAFGPLLVIATLTFLFDVGLVSSGLKKKDFDSFPTSRTSLHNLDNHLIDSPPYPLLLRASRQTTKSCNKKQWQCKNQQCIEFHEQCDGEINCEDGSDETFAKCRFETCPSHLYQCAYGACVDGDSECNHKKNCADNSDEDNKKCRSLPNQTKCGKWKYQCDNDQCIKMHQLCDGVADCNDKSDESIYLCSDFPCPSHLFRCAYGACVDGDAGCNNKKDCEDASDEFPEMCNNIIGYNGSAYLPSFTTISLKNTKEITTISAPTDFSGKCKVPPRPLHGNYKIAGREAIPGEAVDYWSSLFYECDKNYVQTSNVSTCLETGEWLPYGIECIKACSNLNSTTVNFRCEYMSNIISCNDTMRPSTIVTSECKVGHIPPPMSRLKSMKCIRGQWDNPTPKCVAACGEESAIGTSLTLGGEVEKEKGSPWHVAIYFKTKNNTYEYICGGTIITTRIVISAAHCFHIDSKGTILSHKKYAIAAGKRLRLWQVDETLAQKSDLIRIITPERYGGKDQSLQHDIALLILETELNFGDSVHPICLDLNDTDLKKKQTAPGSIGKVVGWGLTIEGDKNSASDKLLVVNLPIIDYNTCKNEMKKTFTRYLTDDKLCAGYMNGTTVCKGDSGGGLVFSVNERGFDRFYLRAIVSVGDIDETGTTCKKNAYVGFTNIWSHKDLILDTIENYS